MKISPFLNRLGFIGVFFLSIAAMSSSSCYYDVEEILYGGSGCDSVNVTYNLSITPMLQTHCYICHDTDAAFGGVILDEYQEVKKYVDDGSLIGSIRHQAGFLAMPEDRAKLNDCNIAILEKWLSEGAPNN